MSRWRTSVVGFVALVCLSIVGCSGGASEESFKPKEDAAKVALTTALEAWKTGRATPGTIDQKPALQVVDTEWEGGAKLANFEIGSMEDFAASRKFQVKLTFVGVAEAKEVSYFVVGKDPLWIFRDKDYPGTAM